MVLSLVLNFVDTPTALLRLYISNILSICFPKSIWKVYSTLKRTLLSPAHSSKVPDLSSFETNLCASTRWGRAASRASSRSPSWGRATAAAGTVRSAARRGRKRHGVACRCLENKFSYITQYRKTFRSSTWPLPSKLELKMKTSAKNSKSTVLGWQMRAWMASFCHNLLILVKNFWSGVEVSEIRKMPTTFAILEQWKKTYLDLDFELNNFW